MTLTSTAPHIYEPDQLSMNASHNRRTRKSRTRHIKHQTQDRTTNEKRPKTRAGYVAAGRSSSLEEKTRCMSYTYSLVTTSTSQTSTIAKRDNPPQLTRKFPRIKISTKVMLVIVKKETKEMKHTRYQPSHTRYPRSQNLKPSHSG
jgi:hypothetical protein